MEQTVYLDLLFLVNFSMDFLTFYLSSKILSLPLSTPRAIAAAICGGIYADASLFLPFDSLASLACDLLACAVMVCIAYGKRGKWKEVPFFSIVYFAVSMALGGFMTAMFNLLNRAGVSELLSGGGAKEDGISVWLFAALALVSAVACALGGKFFRRRAALPTAGVRITYMGKSKSLTALVDSGNLLRDPISARPCVVVNAASVADIIPHELSSLCDGKRLDASRVSSVSEESAKRLRLIPGRTANGSSLMLGLCADSVEIEREGKSRYEVDALVVLSSLGSSAERTDALLPSELLL